LYLDVKDCFYGAENAPVIVGGRYGLGSKDTTPAQIIAVYKNLAMPMPKNHFTIGIVDDVTFTSLPQEEEIALGGEGMFEAKFYGLGADGTVGANKNSVKIIGDNTDKPTSTARLTSLTTPRNQAVSLVLTCVSAILRSAPHIW